MGQRFSSPSPYAYVPPKDSYLARYQPSWFISDAIGGDSFPDGEEFYVDNDDPESLVPELKKQHMVGILLTKSLGWNESLRELQYAPKGHLFLIDWDEMPTYIIDQNKFEADLGISAVYSANLAGEATLYLGGEELRKRSYDHPVFYQFGQGGGVKGDEAEYKRFLEVPTRDQFSIFPSRP